MKKLSMLFLLFLFTIPLTACNSNSKVPKSTNTATPDSSSAHVTPSHTVGNNLEAGLGDLKMYYNNNWTYDKAQSKDASLAFTRDNALIGVTCSMESTYQNGLDMIQTSQNMLSTNDSFKILQKPHAVKVKGETWYEFSYETKDTAGKQISIQRCYGNNYYAYTITYSALEKDYEKYKSNATAILNSCELNVPDNELGEAAAKKELVGELDAGEKGYLVLNNDDTYYWYLNSSKSMDNVHYGTYGCDDQIKSMQVSKGHGLYLCLFPEKFFADGKEANMGTYKINFAISTSGTSEVECDYSALNTSNSQVYYLNRVK